MKKFAEEMNYWGTTVHPMKSQGEVLAMLEDFGAESTQVTQGTAGGNYGWLVKFHWKGNTYRFTFMPLVCKNPDLAMGYGGKRLTHKEQSRYQMGRIAVFFIKALLTAAETQPDALFGFLELPSKTGGYTTPREALEKDSFYQGVIALPAGDEDVIDLEAG
jgi:hypothetical protein